MGVHQIRQKKNKVAMRMTFARNYGGIEPFQPEQGTIIAYLERVDLYFEANEVPVAKGVIVM